MSLAKQTAAVIVPGGGTVKLEKIDVPKPGQKEVLVKVVAAALNPRDCKFTTSADFFSFSFCLRYSQGRPPPFQTGPEKLLAVTSPALLKSSALALRLFAS
jgi:NADPH:quinone reductase-like Zn-dependent oxidoreductase